MDKIDPSLLALFSDDINASVASFLEQYVSKDVNVNIAACDLYLILNRAQKEAIKETFEEIKPVLA